MTKSVKQSIQHVGQQIKAVSLATACTALLCTSVSSYAGVISSSLGNAIQINLQVENITPLAIDLGEASGTAPTSYNNQDSVADLDLTNPFGELNTFLGFDSALQSVLIGAVATSTLETAGADNFESVGSSSIEDLSFTLFQDILPADAAFPALDFISLSNTTLSTMSKVVGQVESGNYTFNTAGSSILESGSLSILGNNFSLSVLDNSPVVENITLFDALGLGVFLNEVTTSCVDSFCIEERNALRISFSNFSLKEFVERETGRMTDLDDTTLLNGDIILASSQASSKASPQATPTPQVNAPSAAMLLALGLVLMSRRKLFSKK